MSPLRIRLVSDALIEVERGQAYAEGFAAGREACMAAHRSLRVVSGDAS